MTKRRERKAASKTHEESSKVVKDIVRKASIERLDVHLDGVGDGTYQSVVDKIAQQRAAGKRVEAHYVTTNVETSVARAIARGEATGREVPEEYIRKMHQEISRLVPQLAKNGDFDKLYLYDNNGSKDAKPILIFSQIGKKITVHDKVKYAAFLKQGV
jgi:predicted ABC-type ATPase